MRASRGRSRTSPRGRATGCTGTSARTSTSPRSCPSGSTPSATASRSTASILTCACRRVNRSCGRRAEPAKGWRPSVRGPCEHTFVSRGHEATILHADLDAFYASVEQRDDARLRGRPVIVGGGVVLASSYEARARGVRTGMGGSRARRLCPDAIVVPPRMSTYSEASKAVFKLFEQFAPVVEGLSIDEAFLDVRGLDHILGSPPKSAQKLKREVREQVGLPITVGVARTKFLAKV